MTDNDIKSIIVFGRGAYFQKKKIELCKKYKIVGFMDNSVDGKCWDEEYSCVICNPQLYWSLLPKNVEIICMSVHFVDMWKQLIEVFGVDEKLIRFGVNINPIANKDKALFSNGELIFSENGRLVYQSSNGGLYYIKSEKDLESLKHSFFITNHPEVVNINKLSVNPASRIFGCEYGKAVDRYYIEKFLFDNSDCIHGTVMEIASSDYIRKYGKNVIQEIILHVNGFNNAYRGNFETGEGINDEMVDCLICTQTLQYIFDLKSALRNIHRMLKPGGVGLFTIPGIKALSPNDSENFGEYWSFTMDSAKRLFYDEYGRENVEVRSYGNVKIAIAYLYGLALEDLSRNDLDYTDPQFPFLITVKVKKDDGYITN